MSYSVYIDDVVATSILKLNFCTFPVLSNECHSHTVALFSQSISLLRVA